MHGVSMALQPLFGCPVQMPDTGECGVKGGADSGENKTMCAGGCAV